MTLYVLSDLHLDERGEARLFSDERQGRALAALCEVIARDEGAELVLLGDIFDFTAMQPPETGLDRFFEAMRIPAEPPPRRSRAQLLGAVRESNPVAFEALAQLSRRAQITLVPGNHDRHLGDPGAAEELAAAGLEARIEKYSLRKLAGRTLVLQHGHEFDKGNRTRHGGGEALTNALHHAVIPFLRHHGARGNTRMDPDRVVALRPEEGVISVLERWLHHETFRPFFRAFIRLLAQNGPLPRALTWLVTPDRVRGRAQRQDRLWERAGDAASRALRGRRRLPHGAPRPDVLVFGHTHVLDWVIEGRKDELLYVNLGTWTERAADPTGPLDTTLPLLELREESGKLIAALRDLQGTSDLQRYEGT
jgi:UDP-2,3-diacylglucosamine pyrophosphatase LpxH